MRGVLPCRRWHRNETGSWGGGGGAPAKLRVEPPGNDGALSTMTLTNGLVERSFSFDASGGAMCTTEYRHLSSGQTYFRGISPEANLTLTTKSAPGRPCEGSGTTLTRRLASMHSAATGYRGTGATERTGPLTHMRAQHRRIARGARLPLRQH
eukprot:COSAG01_NODE_34077_length_558_cov_0.349451_1_plen_152_part_01